MPAHRRLATDTKNKLIFALLISLLALAACLGLGSTPAYADRWEIFDQGEHLLLPEGPIEADGVVMVPLRTIAERFGYSFVSITSAEVTLKNTEGRTVIIKLGTKRALLSNPTGFNVQLMEQQPRNYNGALFIDLALAGAMGGQGHSVVPGTRLIQLRPAAGDAKETLQRLYWYTFSDSKGTVALDYQGREQLNVSYTNAQDFGYEELIPVKQSGYTAGYMNRAGELAISAPHDQLGPFSEGLAWFRDVVKTADGKTAVKMGYLNRSGKVVLPGIYNRASDFSDGMAKVLKDGKTYYIDHNGKTVIPFISGTTNAEPFSEGRAAVSVRVKSGGKTAVKTGFIDSKGKWALQPIYDWAGSFSEGIAAVTLNGRSGLIDKQGKWIVNPQSNYQFLGSYQNGYILVSVAGVYNYKHWLVDKRGKMIAVPGADQLASYGAGLVSYYDEMLGIKDFAGKVIVEPMFTMIAFHPGAIKGYIYQNDSSFTGYLMNPAGKIIWSGE